VSTTQPPEGPRLDGPVPREAQELAVQAVRMARAGGCDCVPDVEMSPMAAAPWWSAMLYHDESCPIVAKPAGETLTAE